MRCDRGGHPGCALKAGFLSSWEFERKTRRTFKGNQSQRQSKFSYGSKTREVVYFRGGTDSIITDRPVFTAENKE